MRYSQSFALWGLNLKGSAAAADPLEGEVPLGVDMTLRGGDMTLRDKIWEGQNWGPWGFSGPGTFKKRFSVKSDVEWHLKNEIGDLFFHDFTFLVCGSKLVPGRGFRS